VRRHGRRHRGDNSCDPPGERHRRPGHPRPRRERALHGGHQQRDHPGEGAAHLARGHERDAQRHLAVLLEDVPIGRTADSLTPIKLAILYKSDTYGTGLYASVTSTLQINGAPVGAAQNSANFEPVEYNADGSDIAAGVAQIVAFQPNLIALFGTNEVVSSGLDAIESSWPTGPARPFYLISDGGECQELLTEISANAGVRTRVRGTVPGTNNPLFQTFSLEYQGTYGAPAEVFGMAGSYDSIYLLAYAITSIGSGTINGTAVSNGMDKMVGGVATNVGTGDIKSAFNTLSAGNAIAINGASGPLHFDLTEHEAPSDINVWCVALDGSNNPEFESSGRSYDATSSMMVGTFSCP
jgi:ABC-type branched-subunit amino acid transport system substrate-binding protein